MTVEALCATETCDRPVRDTTVCVSCLRELEQALGDMTALAEELDTTLSRQTAMGDRSGGSPSAIKPLPYDPRASEALWVLRNTLVGWVRELSEEA